MTNNKIFNTIPMKAVGVTSGNCQKMLHNYRNRKANMYLTLAHEPNNEKDKNAMAIYAVDKESKKHCLLGYLPGNVSYWVRRAKEEGRIVRPVKATVTGGNNRCLAGLKFSLLYEVPKKAEAPVVEIPAPAMA